MASAPRDPSVTPVISVKGLVNRFGEQTVHEGLDLEVWPGEVLGVVGGSGAGKSVLMRSIIGLRQPDEGHIEVLGRTVTGMDATQVPDLTRQWGVLFQGGALFSGLTVAENIQVPLREYFTLSDALMNEIAAYKIAMVGLQSEAGPQYPSELSGGMRKRAALARSLALDPRLLFLDEPTAGLDPISADGFDTLIRTLAETMQLTVFLITHDLDTLHAICDRVAVIADRRIIASGTVEELTMFDHPWVQEYFGGARGRAAAASQKGSGRAAATAGQQAPEAVG
jgi:phospholipid/cholesterol/gamma-HCH transport system ATP-binding protein